MKYNKIFLRLLVSCLAVTFLNASESWTTGAYTNNANIQKILTIPNAETLTVTIVGETEKHYDFVTIENSQNHIVKKVSGKINKTFSVSGNTITAYLNSDYSITKSGVTVTIEDPNDQSEKLILYPPKETILKGGPVYFHVADGVTELRAYNRSILESKMLLGVDTTKNVLRVCAVKENNESCIDYRVRVKNPFDPKIYDGSDYITYLDNNSKGKTLHLYQNDNGGLRLILSKYLDGETTINLCQVLDWSHYNTDVTAVISGDHHGRWTKQTLYGHIGPCEGP